MQINAGMKMNGSMKMNTVMTWIHEWDWMVEWKWIHEWNEYKNETECSLDINEGTDQFIIECTTHSVWMKNLCTNTCSSELPKGSKW